MLFIVDGTGPYSDAQYGKDFSNSFCKQLDSFMVAPSKYYVGPGTFGFTTGGIASCGLRDIRAAHRQGAKIYLAGYSRGGAAVMNVAKLCARNIQYDVSQKPGSYSGFEVRERSTPSIPIEAMFLLDPVAKDITVDAEGVPSNVKNCYVMYRDLSVVEFNPPLRLSDFQSKADKGLAIGFGLRDPDRYARKFMENAGVYPEKGNSVTKFTAGAYTGRNCLLRVAITGASHGAIGGLPWPERTQDEVAYRKAAEVLNGWLKQEGLVQRVCAGAVLQPAKPQFPKMSDKEIEALQTKYYEEANRMQDRVKM